MSNHSMIEGLESRTLMSAAPPLLATPVKADRAVIHAELLKFRTDIAFCALKIKIDNKAMAKAGLAAVSGIDPLITTLKTDVKAMQTQLKIDRLTEASNALADESVIKLDIRQIIIDRKNATAEAADHTKLRADRITLQNDLIAGLDSRIATRMTDQATISNDATAIVTAVNADTGASAALVAATTTFSVDKTACLAKLAADLTAIASARATLVADLTAAQST